jgi:hypothetical protein
VPATALGNYYIKLTPQWSMGAAVILGFEAAIRSAIACPPGILLGPFGHKMLIGRRAFRPCRKGLALVRDAERAARAAACAFNSRRPGAGVAEKTPA